MTKRKPLKGWVPDLPDIRHYAFAPALAAPALPAKVDLRSTLPAVWNQGSIGSCVAHGCAALHISAQRRGKAKKEIMPARLALYYKARAASGWANIDSGCYIVQAMKTIAKYGVADEKLYPYLVSKFKEKPPAKVYADALLHQGLVYRRVDHSSPTNVMSALAQGLPVVFGSTLYSNSYDLVDNVMPLPQIDAKVVGGHCMVLVGYDLAKRLFLVRNSWGKSWGDNGHHWMSFDYICDTRLTDDVWVLETVEV